MYGANPGLVVLDSVGASHEEQVSTEQVPHARLPQPLHISMPPGSC